jgi:hypothetical protein
VADTSHTPGCLIKFDVFKAFIFNFKVLHLIVIAGTGAEKTPLFIPLFSQHCDSFRSQTSMVVAYPQSVHKW